MFNIFLYFLIKCFMVHMQNLPNDDEITTTKTIKKKKKILCQQI